MQRWSVFWETSSNKVCLQAPLVLPFQPMAPQAMVRRGAGCQATLLRLFLREAPLTPFRLQSLELLHTQRLLHQVWLQHLLPLYPLPLERRNIQPLLQLRFRPLKHLPIRLSHHRHYQPALEPLRG